MVLLWAVAYLAAAIAGHARFMRSAVPGNSVVRFMVLGGCAGLGLGMHMFASYGLTLATFATLTVYAFACELYIFLFTLVGSSIGVKLLLALREKDLTSDQIEILCDTTGMVQGRVERMTAVGLLERTSDHWRVSPKGRRLVRTFLALREFFLPASGEGEVAASRPALDTAPKPLL